MTTHALMELADQITASLGKGASVATRRAWATQLRTAAAEGGCGLSFQEQADRRRTLVDALRASKGWMTAYAEAFVDEFQHFTPTHSGAGRDGEFALNFFPSVQDPTEEGDYLLYNQCDGYHLATAYFDDGFDCFMSWGGGVIQTACYQAWAKLPESHTDLFNLFAIDTAIAGAAGE